ncbi:MAG: hypothetical protein FOGNACKC_05084 [Anaerolineae bacterium]|nr:hypothetical protein [Anaerolineae bacterium]
MTLIRHAVSHPHRLQWWQWGQILGVALPLLLLSSGLHHPLLWAVAVHFFIDFTVQTDETAAGKRQRKSQVLLYHAFIAGGYVGLILAGLPGLILSAIIHLLIDATDKFGRTGLVGGLLDQTAHLATLFFIWWLL